MQTQLKYSFIIIVIGGPIQINSYIIFADVNQVNAMHGYV